MANSQELHIVEYEMSVNEDGNSVFKGSAGKLGEAWFATHELRSGLLPPRVVWISRDGHSIIMERPPTTVNITWKPAAARIKQEVHEFSLPLPWQVYVFSTQGARMESFQRGLVFFRNRPIMAESDEMFELPIPNLSIGAMCLGSRIMDEYTLFMKNAPKPTITIAVNFLINNFWTGQFNADLILKQPKVWPAPLRGETPDTTAEENVISLYTEMFQRWSGLTQQDALAFEMEPALQRGWRTVEELMKTFEQEKPDRYTSSIDFLTQMAKKV